MIAFGYGLHWLFFGISEDFGHGLFVGIVLMYAAIFTAWKVAPETFFKGQQERFDFDRRQ